MQSHEVHAAIETAENCGRFFCKFLSVNDLGLNKSHQEGIYAPKPAAPLFFPDLGQKGENKERNICFHIENYPTISVRAIWYGKGTRSEYRLTRFWAHSPFQRDEQLGNLLIIVQASDEDYHVFILDKEEEIETFLNRFSISLVQNSAVVGLDIQLSENQIGKNIDRYASTFSSEFPSTIELAIKSRELSRGSLFEDPDKTLIGWINTEYETFKAIERVIYHKELTTPFNELEPFVSFANTVLNRRKSRAGQSLEHHVSHILNNNGLIFSHQGTTENNKKPDFIFPSIGDYKDDLYDCSKLTFLGVKTTCKDRWRQILSEADRIPEKHLLTLQQSISSKQLKEMITAKVQLVVPKIFHKNYPMEYRGQLLDIKTFIGYLKEKYSA